MFIRFNVLKLEESRTTVTNFLFGKFGLHVCSQFIALTFLRSDFLKLTPSPDLETSSRAIKKPNGAHTIFLTNTTLFVAQQDEPMLY